MGTLFFIHGGAAVLTGVVALGWAGQIALWTALTLSFYRSLRRHGLRTSPGAVTDIEIDQDGDVSVRRRGTETWWPCRLQSRFIHPWLVLLSVRVAGRRWPVSVIVTADAVAPEAFRRLRVRLRLPTIPA
jgi:toxin CptA